VVGELEYEIGAALRNPYWRPDLFAEPAVIRKRIRRFASELGLDAGRVLSWGFAQAVLSAIWSIEDGFGLGPENGAIALANAMLPMLDDPGDLS
jgi:streptomycin 6-kinase